MCTSLKSNKQLIPSSRGTSMFIKSLMVDKKLKNNRIPQKVLYKNCFYFFLLKTHFWPSCYNVNVKENTNKISMPRTQQYGFLASYESIHGRSRTAWCTWIKLIWGIWCIKGANHFYFMCRVCTAMWIPQTEIFKRKTKRLFCLI